MNTTSQAILQTVLATDNSLLVGERNAIQRLINGETEALPALHAQTDERLLITQKNAAELPSVSRVTIWRMTKDGVLHPVEILPGTWRYSSPLLPEVSISDGDLPDTATKPQKHI